MYVYIHIYAYIHIYMCTYICKHLHIHTATHTYFYMLYMHIAYIHIYIYIHTYIHTYIHILVPQVKTREAHPTAPASCLVRATRVHTHLMCIFYFFAAKVARVKQTPHSCCQRCHWQHPPAAHCNMLQHPATCCNTLVHSCSHELCCRLRGGAASVYSYI